MELLPVTSRHDFATRDDVLATATLLRGEMAELRGHMELRFGKVERMIAMSTAANVVGAVSVLVT